jgi:hypothetical protein
MVTAGGAAIACAVRSDMLVGKHREAGKQIMAVQLEIIMIAAVVAVGLIVLGKALMSGFAISRRPSHPLSTRTGASPVPPAVDVRPPE